MGLTNAQRKSLRGVRLAPRSADGVRRIATKVAKNVFKKEVEEKHSYAGFNTGVSNSHYSNQITSLITVGTGDTSNRIGDRYRLTRMQLGFNMAVGDSTNVIRCILLQWMNNSTPSASEIFENTSTTGQVFGDFSSDSVRSGALRVIRDFHWTLNNVNRPNHMVTYRNISLKGCKPVQMVGGSATAGWGTLYLIAVSDSSAIAHPVLQAEWSLKYRDA